MLKTKQIFLIYALILLLGFTKSQTTKKIKRERAAGVLMHITSLPSNYGVGTLGKAAFDFVDFLSKAKQKYWQTLPVGPTGYGDSPYSSTSSYAGNPYMIDLDLLISEKLLLEEEVKTVFWGEDRTKVDYGIQYNSKYPILEKAFSRFKPDSAYDKFLEEHDYWLNDYAMYMSLREHFGHRDWLNWPEDIKLRKSEAMIKYQKELEYKINFIKFIQFKFYEQFDKLKAYCKEKGIKLIGDVPIYVPVDSSDVWANPKVFQLDENLNPLFVSGCPPDFSSPDGQLWGNPCYDWDYMAKDDFKWYINRLKHTGKLFDVIRIDHFRGLESYWAVPYGEPTARNGKWVKGPDTAFMEAIHKYLPDIDFILEDLGYLTEETIALRDGSGFPGMKILEYAFNAHEKSIYLPYFYNENTVTYPGTHDNEVLSKWQTDISQEDRWFCERYFGLPGGTDLRYPILRAGMASVSYLFVAQLQDYIGLGGESRMNVPGTNDGRNWRWRALPEQVNDQLAGDIAYLTLLYGR